MRLHTDSITPEQINTALEGLYGVTATVKEHGSKSHDHAYEVRLEGNGTRAGYATKNHQGATWDEWGVFIARLYEHDMNAMWGNKKNPVYYSRWDFHEQTQYRFDGGTMPEDTHPKHKWDYVSPRYFACKKCSAERVS